MLYSSVQLCHNNVLFNFDILCATFLDCAQLRLRSVHASVHRFDKEAPVFLKIMICLAGT